MYLDSEEMSHITDFVVNLNRFFQPRSVSLDDMDVINSNGDKIGTIRYHSGDMSGWAFHPGEA
jgi:hypothetical protein